MAHVLVWKLVVPPVEWVSQPQCTSHHIDSVLHVPKDMCCIIPYMCVSSRFILFTAGPCLCVLMLILIGENVPGFVPNDTPSATSSMEPSDPG